MFIRLSRSLFVLSLLLVACAPVTSPTAKMQLAATTAVVADVVRQVGGEFVQVETLIPAGSDAHEYTPRPQDAVTLSKARLIFANGAGLEEFLQPLLQSAGATERLVDLSQNLALLEGGDEGEASDHAHQVDPHTWFDPNNVILWSETIAQALAQADPQHAEQYRQNAQTYQAQLRELDSWIRQQVEQISPEQRKLVVDHLVFGYFAQQYGFEQIGAILPSFSSAASPSARDLAQLEETIRSSGVKVIFVEEMTNQQLAEQISRDTGVKLVHLYHDLTTPGSEADTYLKFMRYNVMQIVNALK